MIKLFTNLVETSHFPDENLISLSTIDFVKMGNVQ